MQAYLGVTSPRQKIQLLTSCDVKSMQSLYEVSYNEYSRNLHFRDLSRYILMERDSDGDNEQWPTRTTVLVQSKLASCCRTEYVSPSRQCSVPL